MSNNIISQGFLSKKYSFICYLVLILILTISAFIYYSEVKHAAEDIRIYSIISTFPNTGLNERLTFATTMENEFSSKPLIIGGLLFALLLDVFLTRRVILSVKLRSKVSIITRIILCQLFVIFIFFCLYIIQVLLVAQILTSQAPQYMSTKSGNNQISEGKVITDSGDIKAYIESDSGKMSVTEDPLLIQSDKKLKTFFEAFFVPRYVRYHETDYDNKFSQYESLPYYLILPNYLIVHDKVKFAKDLAYDVMRNITISEYSSYISKTNPDFVILPEKEYKAEYARTQINVFKKQISAIESTIEKNKNIITKNDQMISGARSSNNPQIVTLEQQVKKIKQDALNANVQGEQYIEKINKEINDYSGAGGESKVISVGSFIPPSKILMREPIFSEENLALGDLDQFIRLLVHESLHYYADKYANKQTQLDGFLYEGLTEYLALKAIGYPDSGMVYISGYPVHIQIMALLAQKIPLSELEKIDFTQDQNLLERDFKIYFPDSDYKSFSDLTEQINTWWFAEGFGKDNVSYVNNDDVLKIKKILKL